MAALHFSADNRRSIDQYLPVRSFANSSSSRPFITLTYASSLDSQIASNPGAQTILSCPASKAMTHYLRTKHDAILVGSGTAIADDPGLNSRLSDALEAGLDLQPRPIVLDRRARWEVSSTSKVVQAAREGRGKGPFVIVSKAELPHVPQERREAIEQYDGEYIACSDFVTLLEILAKKGIRSVMVEGGGQIINSILKDHADLIDAVIVTIAPVYLGRGGVVVCPEKGEHRKSQPAMKFHDAQWLPLENDVVMCARIQRSD